MAVTWKKLAYEDDVVLKTLFSAKGSIAVASGANTPADLTIGSTGDVLTVAAGTAAWAPPAAPSAHNLFSTSHGDTTGAANPVDGDIIIGNVTPKWSKLAISVPGAGLINMLAVANGETRPSWKALFDTTNPTTIGVNDSAAPGSAVVAARRDHQHASPATFPPSAHALSAHTAAAGDISMGGHQLTDNVIHTVADATARAALTAVVGKFVFQTDTLGLYVCTVSS